jgi:AcrR family transcriptional regulator
MATLLKPDNCEKPAHTAHGEAMQQALIRAAYDLIAEKGFEGLRTRDVADRAGVNIATLHYYFKYKEDLIRGVVRYLREQFRSRHAPPPAPAAAKPLEYVRQEFADISYQIRELSDNYIVMFEIFLRSLRDESIRDINMDLDLEWLACVEAHIAEGVRQGVFRPDLDVTATAAALIAFIKGAIVQSLFSVPAFPAERVYTQVERWLTDYASAEAANPLRT